MRKPALLLAAVSALSLMACAPSSETASAETASSETAGAAPAYAPLAVGAPEWTAIKDTLWAKELKIYAARGQGDFSVYINAIAVGYLSWPPGGDVPARLDGLQQTQKDLKGKDQEKLEMTFLDLAVSGDTAVIFYKTHRTSLSDGTPADQHYEVTHIWIRQGDDWKLFSGMARDRPSRG